MFSQNHTFWIVISSVSARRFYWVPIMCFCGKIWKEKCLDCRLKNFVWLRRILLHILRKHAYSNMLKIAPPIIWKFSDEKFWYFSYFCSKHWLWVQRTASTRRFYRMPTICVSFLANKKNNVYLYKPQFYYIKVGFNGVKITYIGVF